MEKNNNFLEVVVGVLLVGLVAFGVWYFLNNEQAADDSSSDINIEADLGGDSDSESSN